MCAREREKVVLVMAMLAERRSKQKWSEDPRNTRWSEGDSRTNVCVTSAVAIVLRLYLSLSLSIRLTVNEVCQCIYLSV